MKRIPFLFILLLVLASCSRIPPVTDHPSTRIPVGFGPEDMIRQENRLLIACRGWAQPGDTGEVYQHVLGTEKASILPRTGDPDSLHFRPHGIFLSTQNNTDYLYVITHDNARHTHPVVRYAVFPDRLEFRELLNSPLLVSPNSLVVSPDGSFFIGNDKAKRDSKMEIYLGLKRCTIVHYDGKGNWKEVAGNLGMVTGINRIGNQLLVSTAREHKLYAFRIEGDQLTNKEVFTKFRGPDNIRLDGDQVLTSGHYKSFAFIKHVKDTLHPAPTVITRIDPKNPKPEILFSDTGERISTGSGAIRVGKQLYIAQIFRSYILKVELPEK